METRIGISGWRYPGWRGTFYPPDLPQRLELPYAATKVNSVEINGSFYSLQRPEFYEAWRQQTPDDFIFAVKGGRFITHMKKLKDVEEATANFFASGLLKLREKLGPILWQFPPQMTFVPERFEAFLKLLPRDMTEAAKLARRHSGKLEGRACTRAECRRELRHAFEIRHESFVTPEFLDMLRRHNAAWVIADAANLWPFYEEVTADFVYCRLHGATELYASGYSESELRRWAAHLNAFQNGRTPADARRFTHGAVKGAKQRDVYAYFDNDAKVHAPFDAMRLASLLGVTWTPTMIDQPRPRPRPRKSLPRKAGRPRVGKVTADDAGTPPPRASRWRMSPARTSARAHAPRARRKARG